MDIPPVLNLQTYTCLCVNSKSVCSQKQCFTQKTPAFQHIFANDSIRKKTENPGDRTTPSPRHVTAQPPAGLLGHGGSCYRGRDSAVVLGWVGRQEV